LSELKCTGPRFYYVAQYSIPPSADVQTSSKIAAKVLSREHTANIPVEQSFCYNEWSLYTQTRVYRVYQTVCDRRISLRCLPIFRDDFVSLSLLTERWRASDEQRERPLATALVPDNVRATGAADQVPTHNAVSTHFARCVDSPERLCTLYHGAIDIIFVFVFVFVRRSCCRCRVNPLSFASQIALLLTLPSPCRMNRWKVWSAGIIHFREGYQKPKKHHAV